MFDSVVVRPGNVGRASVDFGTIAEAMVFYGQVHLFLEEGNFQLLLAQIGLDDLLLLAEAENLQMTILRDVLATHEAKKAGSNFYDFVSVQKIRQNRTERDPQDIVREAFLMATGKPGKSRRSALRFLRHCRVTSINEGVHHEKGIPELSREDLRDSLYVADAIRAALSVLAPGYRPHLGWRFDLDYSPDGYRISTDLDFSAINAAHRESFPASGIEITIALLLDTIHAARGDLFLASRYAGELMANDLSAAVVSMRVKRTVEGIVSVDGCDQLQVFQTEMLHGQTIREAINRGERGVKDLLELVESAARFRAWLAGKPGDGRIIGEYSRALVANTWAEKLPTKITRYIVFTALAAVVEALAPSGLGVSLGIGLGIGDTFLLDKVLKGWRPNQFVENDLTRFLSRGEGVEKRFHQR